MSEETANMQEAQAELSQESEVQGTAQEAEDTEKTYTQSNKSA